MDSQIQTKEIIILIKKEAHLVISVLFSTVLILAVGVMREDSKIIILIIILDLEVEVGKTKAGLNSNSLNNKKNLKTLSKIQRF